MGRDRAWREQAQNREGAEGPLEGHKAKGEAGGPGEPDGQIPASQQAEGYHHQQGEAHQEGIEAVEPLQEDLKIHLPPWQQTAVTERPVWTGQAGFHDPGGASDRHQGDQGDDQMAKQQAEALKQRRGRGRFRGGRRGHHPGDHGHHKRMGSQVSEFCLVGDPSHLRLKNERNLNFPCISVLGSGGTSIAAAASIGWT
jgi:hypothetical protein